MSGTSKGIFASGAVGFFCVCFFKGSFLNDLDYFVRGGGQVDGGVSYCLNLYLFL